jgi:hypothetical protein
MKQATTAFSCKTLRYFRGIDAWPAAARHEGGIAPAVHKIVMALS